eukprot:6123180-Prymnesium_polylepis.2
MHRVSVGCGGRARRRTAVEEQAGNRLARDAADGHQVATHLHMHGVGAAWAQRGRSVGAA